LGSKSKDVFIMPLAFTVKIIIDLQNILELTLSNIQQNLKSNDLTNLAAGEVFKSIAKQFDPDIVVPFVLYLDNFQINNALGSHTFSICGCYINFPLMPKHSISKVQYIYHVAFIATDKLKKCRNENSVYHLVEEFKILESGIIIRTKNGLQKVQFILSLIVGNNLAVNSILGYVQSFNSKRYCGVCSRTKPEMKIDSSENVESLRTEQSYYEDLQLNNFQESGLKQNWIFNELLSLKVINNFCFEIMHDIFEGVCKYDICHILISLINKGIITLNEINSRKSLFPYGETSVKIEMNRLKTCNLKTSASETECLTHFLPLMIGDRVPHGNEEWELLLTLLDIIEFLLKSNYKKTEIETIRSLVQKHLRRNTRIPSFIFTM